MEKLLKIREQMNKEQLDAYIMLNSDAHQSEYIADYWQSIAWLTNFTGSNAVVVVTKEAAILWTDGRYFIQAEKELQGSGFELYKLGEEGVPTYSKYLGSHLAPDANVGFDGRAMGTSSFTQLKKAMPKATFRYTDLIQDIWQGRPELPQNPVWAHGLQYAGKTPAEKLADVREKMAEKHADAYVVGALDDIMWLTNLRGSDVENSTVAFAYALITLDKAYLFIDDHKLSADSIAHLGDFELHPYDAIFSFDLAYESIAYNDASTSVLLFESLLPSAKKINVASIIGDLKAIKNETEIKNIENSQLKEGVSLVRLYKWLEDIDLGKTTVTEYDVEEKLKEFRHMQEGYLEDSFHTIAGYAGNGAIVHYRSQNGGDKLEPQGLLLVDTGAHYVDGTTDTTRTLPLGPLTDEMKKDYTLVLKANLALSRAIFPKGTKGIQLDSIARQYIWQAMLDYKHGTGHGVGFCLGVHEGPQSISSKLQDTAIQVGMLSSNEPGLYRGGSHGIRIETLILAKVVANNEFGTFLGFDVVSYAPISTVPVVRELMTAEEIQQLNDYNQLVFDKLAPYLMAEEQVWLREATRAI